MMVERRSRGTSGPGLSQSPEDAELSKRLRDLDRRLDASRPVPEKREAVDAPAKPGMAAALRYGADFVGAVIIGAALGWGVDRLFGTAPWGLGVLLLLGFAAGVLNVMRTAGVVSRTPGGGDDFTSLRK
jgi:ATP synthase protein I